MFKFLIDYIDPNTGPNPNLHGAQVKPSNLKGEIIPSYYALEHDNWFYPICLNTLYHLNTFFHTQSYLEKLLPKNVVKGLEQKKGYILVEILEPMRLDIIQYLEIISERSPLFNRIKFLTINQCSHKNFYHFTVHETTGKTLDSESVVMYHDDFKTPESKYIEEISKLDDRLFSCFMYTFSKNPDRFEILSIFEKLNLLDKGFVSAVNKAHNFNDLYRNIGWSSTLNLGNPPSFTSQDKLFANLPLRETFNKTKINLVVEGDINSVNHNYLTEKTFRNFKFKKPFIILGQCGSLKMLKELGYKTFSDIIDESYDEIEDDKLRIYTALRELIRFGKRSPDISTINSVLEHNFSHRSSKDNRVMSQLSALFDVR